MLYYFNLHLVEYNLVLKQRKMLSSLLLSFSLTHSITERGQCIKCIPAGTWHFQRCGFYSRIWVESLLCGDSRLQGMIEVECNVRHLVGQWEKTKRPMYGCIQSSVICFCIRSVCCSIALLLVTDMIVDFLFCLHFSPHASFQQKRTWMNNDEVVILQLMLTSTLIAPYL